MSNVINALLKGTLIRDLNNDGTASSFSGPPASSNADGGANGSTNENASAAAAAAATGGSGTPGMQRTNSGRSAAAGGGGGTIATSGEINPPSSADGSNSKRHIAVSAAGIETEKPAPAVMSPQFGAGE